MPVYDQLEVQGDVVLAVIADTHGRPHPRAVEHIAAMRPRAILHAGDVGDRRCLEPFAELAPVYAVRGNIDGSDWPDARVLVFREAERVRLTLVMTHIAVAHLKPNKVALAAAFSQRADLIVCGHSHVPFLTTEQGVVLFNPGSVGPRRFHLPIVFGRMELRGQGLALTHHGAETGEPWQPMRGGGTLV